MYAVAERLDPDSYLALARATYREMVASGITAVGEFHYLHHQADGTPYDDPNAMGRALQQAAQDAGLRIRLLDTAYLSSGFGEPPVGVQERFSDGTAVAWAERIEELDGAGAAIHSVRAVPDDQLRTIVDASQGRPLHVHLSEQTAENDACVAAYGATPTQLLADHGVLGPLTSAVHATHLTDDDIAHLGATRTYACFCPTTERDLGDGIGPSRRLHDAGSPLTLGSDSHAVIDLFEEMRAVELDERLATRRRGHWTAAGAASGPPPPTATPASGTTTPARSRSATAPTWSPLTPPRRAPQAPAATSTRPSSRPPPSDVVQVVADGKVVFTRGDELDIGRELDDTIGRLWAVLQHRHHQHRRAGHQRPAGRDPSASSPGPPSSSTATGSPGPAAAADAPAADVHVDAGGRAVIPGFVDSHSHLVFAGDRAPEFAARMAGTPYAAGGIRTTVAATRAATDEQLTGRVAALVGEMRRQGTTTVEIKSGYGLTDPGRGAQPGDRPTVHRRDHVPRRARGPRGQHTRGVRRPGHRADARRLRPARALGRRVLRARRVRRGPGAGGAAAGAARGLRGRLHANQLGHGPGVRLAAELGPGGGRPLHVPRRRRRRGAGRQRHGRDPAARAWSSRRRQPYPDARRLLDAGVSVAIASDCNPGSSYTSSMPLCVALAVRGDADDAGGGDVRRHGRWRRRSRPHRRRPPGAGFAAPTWCYWTPPATSTWRTDRGCRW